jgi:hypothetical protein
VDEERRERVLGAMDAVSAAALRALDYFELLHDREWYGSSGCGPALDAAMVEWLKEKE